MAWRDVGRVSVTKVAKKVKKKQAPVTKSPAGDTNKDAGYRSAERFKQTSPKYAASVRAAYKHAPVEARQQRVASVKAKTGQAKYRKALGLKPRSVEDAAVLAAHQQRHAADLRTIKKIGFLPRVRYAQYLKQYQYEHERTAAGLTQAELDDVKKAETPADRKRIAAEAAIPQKSYAPSTLANLVSGAPGGLAKRAGAIVEATYHDPLGVPVKTGKQAVLAVPAAAAGTVELVRHPIKTVSTGAKQFAERSDESYEAKVKRIRKEGAFDDAADLAMAVTPASAATSAAARAALLGKLGERAAVRVTGNVVKQRAKAGLTRTLAGHAVDAIKARHLERDLQAAEAGGRSMDAIRYKAATANRRAGKTAQVVPRSVKAQQRRAVATERGKSVYRLRSDQKQRLDAVQKHINKLNKNEKRAFWYAAALGIRHNTPAEHRNALLTTLRDDIVAGRNASNIKDIKGSTKRSDMLPDLERIIAEPDAHFTEKLSDVVEALRPEARKAAIEDPRLVARQANERRWAPLAQVLKVARGETEDTSTWRYTAPAPHTPKDDTIDGSLAALPARPIPGQKQLGSGELKNPPAIPDEGNGVGKALPPWAIRMGREYREFMHRNDDAMPHAGFYEEVPGHRYNPDETRGQYRARVAAEAKRRGLAKPIYFKSERYVGPTDFAARALGGRRAMKDDFRYTGENLRVGLQDTSPGQYMRGLARNIKAKHNWESIAKLLDQHRIDITSPAGTTISDLRKRVYDSGIDESSIVYWNPGIFRDRMRTVAPDVQAGEAAAQGIPGSELSTDSRAQELAPEAHDAALTRTAMKDAVIGDPSGKGAKGLATPDQLTRTSGWHAIPVEVMHEIERQTTPSRALARGFDVLKGKSSRAILLTGNVPWAAFQVASNASVSALASGGRTLNPANWLGAHRWWKELSPEDRTRIGAEIGLDTAGADYAKTHLGASTNSDIVNTYRAMKAHPLWHTGVAKGHGPAISELNPLELMAAFDRKQNNATRITTAFAGMKKEAVREMGKNMGRADQAQAKLTGILAKKDVRDQVRELAKNPKLLEQHAEAVHDWLGDYTSMTSFERQAVNRVVMFYPYLRYSLKLTFYTMPLKHPIMTSILAELGSMRANELKDLLGGDRLYWDTGKVYFGSGGDVKEIDLRRANPALNALWDVAGSRNNSQLVGVLPPYGQMLLDQLFHRTSFADREWRTEGKAAEYGKKGQDYGSILRAAEPGTVRNRVLVGQIARMFYPYRVAVDRSDSMQGVQGDDSLLGSPRPIKFKGKTYVSKLKADASKKQAEFKKENQPGLLESVFPFVPQPSRDFESAKEQAKIAAAEKHPPKKHKKSKYNLGGSGMGGIK